MARRTRPELEQEAQTRIYQIEWTDKALDTFDEAYVWIAETNEEKADEFYSETLLRIEQLAELPFLGPMLSDLSRSIETAPSGLVEFLQDKRQLLVSRSHRVIYQVDEEAGIVSILLVHPTRLPLSRLLQDSDES